jgi:hypothetical protein
VERPATHPSGTEMRVRVTDAHQDEQYTLAGGSVLEPSPEGNP